MMKMLRTPKPTCLSENHNRKYPAKTGVYYPKWKHWGFVFRDKKDASKFDWNGTREEISTELQNITKNHCSFCDCYPIGTGKIKDTIEHFRPKHLSPLLAYYWGNLFLCCHYCQEIPENWDNADLKLVLKPDQIDYEFHKYFIFDTRTGEIKVNPYNRTMLEKKRASKTITYYKLNDYFRPQARLEAFALYQNQPDFDKREYRFMF